MASAKLTVGNVEIACLLDTPMEFPWSLFFVRLEGKRVFQAL